MPSPLADAVPFDEVHRVLIIKLRHHGDVLLTSPVLSVLKAHAPHIEIDALVFADTAPMLTHHPALDELFVIDRAQKKRGIVKQLSSEWALFQQLQSRDYDLVIHLTDHPRGAWLAKFLGARWAVAPKRDKGARWWKKFFTHLYPVPGGGTRHTVECHLDALRRIGIQATPAQRRLTLVAGSEAETHVRNLLAEYQLSVNGYIHFHPTSRWFFKTWPVAQNAKVLAALVARGEHVVITAAPDKRECAMVDAILEQAAMMAPDTNARAEANSIVNLAGKVSLKELSALTSHAKLFVGVDSAPMHIASAVDTPTVALFGPSGDKEWGPWMVPHEIVMSNAHPCRPCGQDGCGGGKVSDCLTAIPAERVLAAIDRVLAMADNLAADDPRR
ncbi:MAG TPA: putative lipopolysaccharide heptosyltransferase III [Rhodocyclaceae bacterium]|nr:putative lipopolysaccharide heptosyltransferase III [Rhodocyclaceae bacterium]